MFLHYRIYFNEASLPDIASLRMVAQHIEPAFDIAESCDFSQPNNDCECQLDQEIFHLKWSLANNVDKQQTSAQVLDCCGTLTFRSETVEGSCAVVIAAALAMLTGGAIVTADEQIVMGDDIPDWAQGEANGYRAFEQTSIRERRRSAETMLMRWLEEVQRVSVRLLPRFDADSSRIIILFGSGSRLIGARWSLKLPDGFTYSSRERVAQKRLPEEAAALEQAVAQLDAAFKSGLLKGARYDINTFNIHLGFEQSGYLIFHAQPPGETGSELGDCWEMLDNRLISVRPDIARQELVVKYD